MIIKQPPFVKGCEPGTVLSNFLLTIQVGGHLILKMAPGGRPYCTDGPYVTAEETEALEGELSCQRSDRGTRSLVLATMPFCLPALGKR